MKELIWNDLNKEILEKALKIERTKTLAIIFLLGFCFGFILQQKATIFLLAFAILVYLIFTTYSKVKQNLTQEKQSST
jgi:hypothetical protein